MRWTATAALSPSQQNSRIDAGLFLITRPMIQSGTSHGRLTASTQSVGTVLVSKNVAEPEGLFFQSKSRKKQTPRFPRA